MTKKVCLVFCLHRCAGMSDSKIIRLLYPGSPVQGVPFSWRPNLQLIKYVDMPLFFNDGEKVIIDLQLQKQYSE